MRSSLFPILFGGGRYRDWPVALDFSGGGPHGNGSPYLRLGAQTYPTFASIPGATFTRSGADLLTQDANGQWRAFAANTENVIGGTGFDIPEGTTNKCTNYNAAPTGLTNVTKSGDAAATLTVVDDTAALRAAGFGMLIDAGKMNGSVYKLDNSAGVGSAWIDVSGAVGNTNPHYPSAFVRGSGTVDVRLTGTAGANRTLTAQYAKQGPAGALTPAATGNVWRAVATAGSVVYIALNQLEEKSYATNPVIVSGVSATRGAASPVITGLSSILTPPFTMVAWANLSAINAVTRTLVQADDGNNATNLRAVRDASNQAIVTNSAGSSSGAFTSKTGARTLKMAVLVESDGLTLTCDGADSAKVSTTMPSGLSSLVLGATRAGASFLNSPETFLGVTSPLTAAKRIEITT